MRAAPLRGDTLTTTSPTLAAAPGGKGGDKPVRLFEAAAQAGAEAGGQEGASLEWAADPFAGTGAIIGGFSNPDSLRDNPQFMQLQKIILE